MSSVLSFRQSMLGVLSMSIASSIWSYGTFQWRSHVRRVPHALLSSRRSGSWPNRRWFRTGSLDTHSFHGSPWPGHCGFHQGPSCSQSAFLESLTYMRSFVPHIVIRNGWWTCYIPVCRYWSQWERASSSLVLYSEEAASWGSRRITRLWLLLRVSLLLHYAWESSHLWQRMFSCTWKAFGSVAPIRSLSESSLCQGLYQATSQEVVWSIETHCRSQWVQSWRAEDRTSQWSIVVRWWI